MIALVVAPSGPMIFYPPAGDHLTPARISRQPQDCIDIAAMAKVPKVVFTHHLSGVEPEFDASIFSGEVIVGSDLDVIQI